MDESPDATDESPDFAVESPEAGGRAQRRQARDRARRARRRNFAAIGAGLLFVGFLVAVVLITRGSSDGADSTDAASTTRTTAQSAASTSPSTTTVTTTPPTTPPTTPVSTAPPTTAPAVARAELRPGMSGSDVVALQQRLITLGYFKGTADGSFGASTTESVKAFQTAKGLTADGVVGQKTWDALNAAQ